MDSGIWLPPQRTFSSLVAGRTLEAERTTHVEVEVERDIAARDGVAARVPSACRRSAGDAVRHRHAGSAGAQLGHYFVGNAGDVDATGLERRLQRARCAAASTARSSTR